MKYIGRSHSSAPGRALADGVPRTRPPITRKRAIFRGEPVVSLDSIDDLFELPAHETSPSGLDGRRERWSDGWRALDPSVSPDGRRVVFTTNHRGTTYLMMADVVPSPHRDGRARARERAAPGRRARPSIRRSRRAGRPTTGTSPTASWQRGGYRDVRIVDTAGRLVRRRDARPRDRRRPVVLGRRPLALLSLGPHAASRTSTRTRSPPGA